MQDAKKTSPRKARSYDAAQSMQRITDAAVRLLSQRGFTALGVNALAAEAGVDKQMIYYHFGGLDGVIRALGAQTQLWLGAALQAEPGEPYKRLVQRLLTEYAKALRSNPLLLGLLAWELAQPSEVLAELNEVRSAAMHAWTAQLRAVSVAPPVEVDAPAINALLLAGLQHLALCERSVGSFAGMDLRASETSARLAHAVACITDRTYATATPAPQG